MSNKIIVLSDYRESQKAKLADDPDPWTEIFSADGACSTLQVYADQRAGEVEVVQLNDDNESIRTLLSSDEGLELLLALQRLNLKRKNDKEQS